MFQPFALFGLYIGTQHTIPDVIEIDLPDFADLDFDPDYDDLMFPAFDWDYLYDAGDMVEDEYNRKGIVLFITPENESPFADDTRYYYVVGLHNEYADYLLPEQIRYAL